jgi:hypothetical protein
MLDSGAYLLGVVDAYVIPLPEERELAIEAGINSLLWKNFR